MERNPDKDETETKKETLASAIKLVNEAISTEEARLNDIALSQDDDNDPIMLEGESTTGCQLHIMTEAPAIAKVLLHWEYPVYKTLELDFPDGMWDELARAVGVDTVYSVDI